MKILISHISVDRSLFEFTGTKDEFDIPELKDNIELKAAAYQSGDSYAISGSIKAKLQLQCDRCCENFDYDIEQNFELIYTSEETVDKDDHIMYLPPQDVEIDLKPYVQDTILLNIPFKKICSEDCKGLCAGCGANLNESKCTCSKDKIDPRWESLKELKKRLKVRRNNG